MKTNAEQTQIQPTEAISIICLGLAFIVAVVLSVALWYGVAQLVEHFLIAASAFGDLGVLIAFSVAVGFCALILSLPGILIHHISDQWLGEERKGE